MGHLCFVHAVFMINTLTQWSCCEIILWELKGRGSKVNIWLSTQPQQCGGWYRILAALILCHGVYCLASNVQIKKTKRDRTQRQLLSANPDSQKLQPLCLAVQGKMFQSQHDQSVQKHNGRWIFPLLIDRLLTWSQFLPGAGKQK